MQETEKSDNSHMNVRRAYIEQNVSTPPSVLHRFRFLINNCARALLVGFCVGRKPTQQNGQYRVSYTPRESEKSQRQV
jgi:acetyltransferase-like isoleucine patch superfamily enzyme